MNDNERKIAELIADAEAKTPEAPRLAKPRLLVDRSNPDVAVAAVRDLLAEHGDLFDRGLPVRLAYDAVRRCHTIQVMTPDGLIRTVHSISRPYRLNHIGEEIDCQFPRQLGVMYLDWRGEWHLNTLNGIASSPLLQDNGSIGTKQGYDAPSGMFIEGVPSLDGLVPDQPSREEAKAALLRIRETFRTFSFADAVTDAPYAPYAPSLVDISQPPGKDESAFLCALMTAVCRPSLPLAPGILIRAAPMSGAGAGKGLLARCISIIAFGQEPHAVTSGGSHEELEKRIATELMEGNPVLFLDNLNNVAFKSDLLASAITERPARVRILGRSEMITLNASALVILTGNGLSVSEDLARRFLTIDFDPRTEDPEARAFPNDIKAEVRKHRRELLAALLLIWRWGRQANDLKAGKPLGSFELWSKWVRDPLLTLGCADPAEQVNEAKERDSRRQFVLDLLNLWQKHHDERPVAVRDLHDDIRGCLDPHKRGRQFVSAQIEKLAGTRIAGYQFTRQPSAGRWGAATYALKIAVTPQEHRHHRGHRDLPGTPGAMDQDVAGPMTPMTPMPAAPANENTANAGKEDEEWKAAI